MGALMTGLDWQPVPGPRREDFRNAAHFCKALREHLGEQEFRQTYRNHGGCVPHRTSHGDSRSRQSGTFGGGSA